MKVYLYRRIYPNLDSTICGFTDDLSIALDYESRRSMVRLQELKIKRKDYPMFVDRLKNYQLFRYRFDSIDACGYHCKKETIATEAEIMQIELHGNRIIQHELSRIKIPSSIFKEKYRDAYDKIIDDTIGLYLQYGDEYGMELDGLECPFEIVDKYKLFQILYEKPMNCES